MPDAIYNIDLEHLTSVDLDAPLKNARGHVYASFINPYHEAAVRAREAGDERAADIYEFLCEIACLRMSVDSTPGTEFAPRNFKNKGRSVAYQDLAPPDCEALRQMAGLVKNSTLAARLFDLSWLVNKRDREAGQRAVEHYLASAQALITPATPDESPEGWLLAIDLFARAIYLASKLGRGKPLYLRATEALLDTLRPPPEHSVKTFRLLEVAHAYHCGDPQQLVELAEKQADIRTVARDFEGARRFLDLAVRWHRGTREAAKESECLRKIAESYSAEAGLCGDDYIRSELLRSAVEAARHARLDRAVIKGLLGELAAANRAAASQLKAIPFEFTFKNPEPEVLERMASSSLREAIVKLITLCTLTDLGSLRESVRKSIGENHFNHMFRTVGIGEEDGRPTVVRNPFVGATAETAKLEFERELFATATHDWTFRAAFFIEPARRYIDQEFNPSISDLVFLTRNNPFVTPGHEAILVRGVHAGFHGDFMISSALLIPQVEQMLRRALEVNGVDVSTLEKDGTQPAKMFGGIFGLEETEQFLGDGLCFELKGHLIEKTGYDLRNRIAHGLARDSELVSAGAVSLWWLVLNMLVCPTLPRVPPEQ